MTSDERWLPVVGWESLYEVSDLGRVRSLRRRGGNNRSYGGRIISGAKGADYQVVNLCNKETSAVVRVHQLVAEAFLGERPQGQEVCHGPGGPFDNRLVNLRYGTRQENCDDTARDGHRPVAETHWNSRLTWDAVASIRLAKANGSSAAELAAAFGVSPKCIRNVVAFRTWRDPQSANGCRRSYADETAVPEPAGLTGEQVARG